MARLKYYNTNSGRWEYADNTSSAYPVIEGDSQIMPGRYHVFGEVDSLTIVLEESGDMMAYEYCFEFIPSANFTGLTISPEPAWANPPQFPVGKTCQVSILRGIGVMVCA